MIIKADRIKKKLGKTMALNDLSFEVKEGIVGLVGRNGAGKSTLLRALSGVYSLDGGTLTCDDVPISLQKPPKGTFFLPDDPYYPSRLTLLGLYEFLSLYYKLDKEALLSLAGSLGLPTDKFISSFSKGMRRQAYLAAALSVDARLLLLDEAFDGLDPLALEKVKGMIIDRYAGQDKIVIIASHNIVSLERLSDTFLLIDGGKLSENGSSEEIAKGLRKIQVVFALPASQGDLEALGIDVIGYRAQGAMVEFMTHSEDAIELIRKRFAPPYINLAPLSSTEIIAYAMEEGEKK